MTHKTIRPKADRLVLELLVANLLGIVLWYNPTRPGGRRGIKGQKVGPGLVQPETDLMRIDDLNALDLFFQFRSSGPFVALKAELHIFGGEGIAVVKLHPLAQLKVVRQAICAL